MNAEDLRGRIFYASAVIDRRYNGDDMRAIYSRISSGTGAL